MPRIIVKIPGKPSQPYQFKPGHKNIQIGRGSGNDIVIDCPSISTLHAELTHTPGGGYILRDLDSTNGIKKDGKRHESLHLGETEHLKLGDVEFEFSTTTAASAEAQTLQVPTMEKTTPDAHAKPAAAPTPTTPVSAKQPAPAKPGGFFGPIVFAILGIAAASYAAFGIEQGTGEVDEWRLFLGRFHPLIVHFPIGLLVIAALFEWLGVIRPLAHLRRAVPALLVFGALGSLAAVYHGVLLASGSGTLGDTVESHLWAGLALTVVMFLLVPLRATTRETPRWLTGLCYQALLFGALILLVAASHLGGSITHGRTYLVEYMPESMRESLADMPGPVLEFIGLTEPPSTVTVVAADELTLYDAVFAAPIGEYCVACHKPDRIRGDLLMHTLDAILEGGDSGPAIVYGDLEASELYTRITLPEDDDYHMPPDDRKGFSEAQTAWFKWWISSGIPGDTPAAEVTDAPADVLEVIQVAIAASVINETGEDASADGKPTAPATPSSWQPSELEAINAVLNAGRIVPVSRKPEDGLHLTTAGAGDAFTDADLEALAPIGPFIIEADLSRTGVSDGGMTTVATWPTLRRLRLDHTAIGDSGVLPLGALAELSSLNLYQTRITNASVDTLLAMPALQSLYVGETALGDDALARLTHLLPTIAPPPPVEGGNGEEVGDAADEADTE